MTNGRERGNSLWDFSWRVYHEPGVAEACLELQDRRGLDVNLLLACCWAGSRGHALSAAEMDRLTAAVAPWQEQVVRPLRGVRRWLKDQDAASPDSAESLRQAIKGHELDAERLEQDILHAALAAPGGGAADPGEPDPRAAVHNLLRYLHAVGCVPNAGDSARLATLVRGAFGAAWSPLRIIWELQDDGPG